MKDIELKEAILSKKFSRIIDILREVKEARETIELFETEPELLDVILAPKNLNEISNNLFRYITLLVSVANIAPDRVVNSIFNNPLAFHEIYQKLTSRRMVNAHQNTKLLGLVVKHANSDFSPEILTEFFLGDLWPNTSYELREKIEKSIQEIQKIGLNTERYKTLTKQISDDFRDVSQFVKNYEIVKDEFIEEDLEIKVEILEDVIKERNWFMLSELIKEINKNDIDTVLEKIRKPLTLLLLNINDLIKNKKTLVDLLKTIGAVSEYFLEGIVRDNIKDAKPFFQKLKQTLPEVSNELYQKLPHKELLQVFLGNLYQYIPNQNLLEFEKQIETNRNGASITFFSIPYFFSSLSNEVRNEIEQQLIEKNLWSEFFELRKTNDESMLTEGPVQKSIYTQALENLMRELMESTQDDFIIEKRGADEYIVFNNGVQFNWDLIRRHANFEHIQLKESDFSRYDEYHSTLASGYQSHLKKANEMEYIRELYEQDAEEKLPEPLITFAEMQAINLYTSHNFKYVNDLLRGVLSLSDIPDKITMQSTLINMVMSGSGLKKVPKHHGISVYRAEHIENAVSGKDRMHAYIEKAANKGVVNFDGFTSTSLAPLGGVYGYRNVYYHLKNARGVYVAPISSYPSEQEFLIPRTQIMLTDFSFKNGKYFFEGEIVSDLDFFSSESIEVEAKIAPENYENFSNLVRASLSEYAFFSPELKFDDVFERLRTMLEEDEETQRRYTEHFTRGENPEEEQNIEFLIEQVLDKVETLFLMNKTADIETLCDTVRAQWLSSYGVYKIKNHKELSSDLFEAMQRDIKIFILSFDQIFEELDSTDSSLQLVSVITKCFKEHSISLKDIEKRKTLFFSSALFQASVLKIPEEPTENDKYLSFLADAVEISRDKIIDILENNWDGKINNSPYLEHIVFRKYPDIWSDAVSKAIKQNPEKLRDIIATTLQNKEGEKQPNIKEHLFDAFITLEQMNASQENKTKIIFICLHVANSGKNVDFLSAVEALINICNSIDSSEEDNELSKVLFDYGMYADGKKIEEIVKRFVDYVDCFSIKDSHPASTDLFKQRLIEIQQESEGEPSNTSTKHPNSPH